MKLFLISFALLTLSVTAQSATWESNCPDAPGGCEDVGKIAFNNAHWLKPGKMRDNMESIVLGKITGVIWRPKGSLIGMSEAIPASNIKASARTAPEDAWYYIIKSDDAEQSFIVKLRDIKTN